MLRALSDFTLEQHLQRPVDPRYAVERALVERELRRREAWAAPAGKSFWISVTALVVSGVSLIVSVAFR